MIDLIKNFFDTSNERIKNPLIGSFIIAWFACNWRPLSIFFLSEAPVEKRISTIVEVYGLMWNNLFLPLLVSLFYVVLLPYIMWGLDYLIVKSTSGRKQIKLSQLLEDAHGKQKLAIAESEIEDARASFREKKDLNQQIEALKQQVRLRDSTVEQQQEMLTELEESNKELVKKGKQQEQIVINDEFQYALEYDEFKNSDLFRFFENIGRGISRNGKIPEIVDILVVEKFQNQEIIDAEQNVLGIKDRHRFTPKGKYFWREFVNNSKLETNT